MHHRSSAGRSTASAGRLLAASLLCLAAATTSGNSARAGDAERGAYLAAIMDCAGCHSGRLPDGQIDPAAHLTGGSIGFELPGLGVFYPPNLTGDQATGLGAWTDAEIVAAIRDGMRPDGRILAPIMPWQSYAVLTDADAADLVAYLRSLPAAASAVPGPLAIGEPSPAPYFGFVVPAAAP